MFPLVGAVVGVIIWLMVDDSRLEDTLLVTTATVRARDTLAGAAARVTEHGETESVEATASDEAAKPGQGVPAPD